MYRFDPQIDVLNAAWELNPSDVPPLIHRFKNPVWPKAPAPVDLLFPESGIRLRHAPGYVDFRQCRAIGRVVAPGQALAREIELCVSGAAPRVTILKAIPVADASAIMECPDCGEAMVPSMLDCALGDTAELVIESLAGHWCWSCLGGVASDDFAALRWRLDRWRSSSQGDAVPSFIYDTPAHPRSVQFEVTTRCNLSCGYCSNRLLPERRDTDFDRLLRLFDHIDFNVVDQVDLTGLGEALLHPRLVDILAEIQRRGGVTDVGMVTNGVSLTPSRIAPLLAAGLSHVSVSVDTLDPERFSRQRPGTRLEKVLANIENLIRVRDEQRLDHFRLDLHAVIVGDPYAEAGPLIDYSARLGLDLPVFTPLDPRQVSHDLYDPKWLDDAMSENEFRTFYRWVIKRWYELGRSASVPTRMQKLHERPVTPARRAEGFHHSALEDYPSLWLCKWAIDKCYVASDGAMLTCCNAITDMPRNIIADLHRRPLRQIWANDLVWAYRLPLALSLLPSGCVGCDQAPPQGRPLFK